MSRLGSKIDIVDLCQRLRQDVNEAHFLEVLLGRLSIHGPDYTCTIWSKRLITSSDTIDETFLGRIQHKNEI